MVTSLAPSPSPTSATFTSLIPVRTGWRPVRRAARLGVHPHQIETFVRELVDGRGVEAGDVVELLVAHLAEAEVVDEDLEDVGAFAAVLLADGGQLFYLRHPISRRAGREGIRIRRRE